MIRFRFALPALVLAATLSACSGTQPQEHRASESPTPPASAASSGPTAGSSSPTPAQLPDTSVAEAAQWVLDQLAAESGPSEEEASERFADVYLQQVPANQMSQLFDDLRAEGPFTLTSWEGTETQGRGLLHSDKTPVRMLLTMVDDKIEGLLFVPDDQAPDVAGAAEGADALAANAENSAFLLAEVERVGEAPECVAVVERNADEPMPIGSMASIYVLGAVATAVEAGTLSWDDVLTVTDEVKSLAPGNLRTEPDGTELTVVQVAGLMMLANDNTATDMLIEKVGREAVEAELEKMGHSDPELMKPFLTTREVFQLAASTPTLRRSWADASQGLGDPSPETTAAQRALLDQLPGGPLSVDEDVLTEPFWNEGIGWYATAEDLCRAHIVLQQRASTEQGTAIRNILGESPGVEVEGAAYVGGNTGWTPGHAGVSFYVEGPDTIRVLVLQTAAGRSDGVPQGPWLGALAEGILANS